MHIRIKLFAAAKDLAGSDAIELEVPDGATIANLHTAILAAHPHLASIVPHALWAVDTQYASNETTITTKSEIALIPPVSGG